MSSRYAILIAGLDRDDVRAVEAKADALSAAQARDGVVMMTWQVTPTALDAHALMAPITARCEQVATLTEERDLARGVVKTLEKTITTQHEDIQALRAGLIQAQTDRDVARGITERARHEASEAKKELGEARTAFDHKIRIADAALVRARDVGATTVGEQLAAQEEIKHLQQQLGRAQGDIHALEVALSKGSEEHTKARKGLKRWRQRVADLKAQIDQERAHFETRETELREEVRHTKDQLRLARAGKEPQAPGPCVQELRAEVLALQETLRHTTRALAALASDRRER